MNSDTKIVLVWGDGKISTGIENLKSAMYAEAYGYADDTYKVLANVNGDLVPVIMEVEGRDEWDDNDYSYPTVRLYTKGRHLPRSMSPFYVFGLRIDGRV